MPGAGAGAGAAEKFYSEPEPEPEPEYFPGAGAGAGADQKCHGSASLIMTYLCLSGFIKRVLSTLSDVCLSVPPVWPVVSVPGGLSAVSSFCPDLSPPPPDEHPCAVEDGEMANAGEG